jgi:hypothetical protein
MQPSKKMSPRSGRAIKLVHIELTEFLLKSNGLASVAKLEKFTGLNQVSLDLVANVLNSMKKDSIVDIVGDVIICDIGKLKEIKEQGKTDLPPNHNKLWTDLDYVTLAECKLQKMPTCMIAEKLGRTEKSVEESATLLRKSYRLIPLIAKFPVIKEFCESFVSPKPADECNIH